MPGGVLSPGGVYLVLGGHVWSGGCLVWGLVWSGGGSLVWRGMPGQVLPHPCKQKDRQV